MTADSGCSVLDMTPYLHKNTILHTYNKLKFGSRSSITMASLAGLGFHPTPGWPKTFSSFGLSVCLSVTLLNVRVCAPDFAMKAVE